jgi:release factor glutamine methyltransferase
MSEVAASSKNELWTIGKVIAAAQQFLQAKGVDKPRLNAELLLASLLQKNRVELYIDFNQPLNKKELDAYRQRISLRAKNYPLQYITGKQFFRHLCLKVSPDVLIPRPETEILVEIVLAWLKNRQSRQPLVVDLGTGSGAIALAIAQEITEARVLALDSSVKALKLAKENARNHQLCSRVDFFVSRLFSGLKENLQAKIEAIVANPPYIGKKEYDNLPLEIKKYEPKGALYGGVDGLQFYRLIVPQARKYLVSGGLLALEIGYRQADQVTSLIYKNGYQEVKVLKDYAGLDRVVTAIWSGKHESN